MKTHSYDHVISFALEHPWALTDSMLAIVANILAHRLVGEATDPDAIAAALVQRKNLPKPKRGGRAAIIPVYGVIAPRMNMLSDMSGGTTFEGLTAQLHEAMASEEVKTIIFDVDSPGGNAAGASEFAAEVLKARAVKPIIAQVQHMMASAAYWPLASATQIVASPSAIVGSIGVYTIHDNLTESLAKLGVKRTVIGAGKFKTEGVGGGELTAEAEAHMRSLVTAAYDRFVHDVAVGRGIKDSAVKNGYGEGRALNAAAALDAGMIDRVGTMADTLARLEPEPSSNSPKANATSQEPPLAATDQERLSDAHWQSVIEGGLLSLDI